MRVLMLLIGFALTVVSLAEVSVILAINNSRNLLVSKDPGGGDEPQLSRTGGGVICYPISLHIQLIFLKIPLFIHTIGFYETRLSIPRLYTYQRFFPTARGISTFLITFLMSFVQ